jgi:signal transduction histidine kinase
MRTAFIWKVFPGVKQFGLFDVLKRIWATGIQEHCPATQYTDERIIGWRKKFVCILPSGAVAAIYTDETDRKQAEEAFQQAHEELQDFSRELERKVQEKTAELQEKNKQFLAAKKLAVVGKMSNRIAHDLRNPLLVIGGFTRRIGEKSL